jgi:heme-degrading monooxygenase HmoA
MAALATRQDGFLGMTSARDPHTRHGITVSYWRDDECARAWKQVAAHVEAQRHGRERWYTEYEVVVAEVRRSYSFAPNQAPAAAQPH